MRAMQHRMKTSAGARQRSLSASRFPYLAVWSDRTTAEGNVARSASRLRSVWRSERGEGEGVLESRIVDFFYL